MHATKTKAELKTMVQDLLARRGQLIEERDRINPGFRSHHDRQVQIDLLLKQITRLTDMHNAM